MHHVYTIRIAPLGGEVSFTRAFPCADTESFVRVDTTLATFVLLFFSWRGERGFNFQWKAGHHRPTSETPFKWWFPALNSCLVALWFSMGSGPVLIRNPIALWFPVEGRLQTPLSTPLDPRMHLCLTVFWCFFLVLPWVDVCITSFSYMYSLISSVNT